MRLGRIRTNAIGPEVGVNGRRYASTSEIAAAERIDRGHLGRILQLTLLAPDIVAAILDGRQPPELGLRALLKPFVAVWRQQQVLLSGIDHR